MNASLVPSQVVELIDQLYPTAKTNMRESARTSPQLAGIVACAREIPPELLTLTGQDLSDYVAVLAVIDDTQSFARANQRSYDVAEHRGIGPIHLLRRILENCPDEVPSPQTAGLLFIADEDLRESIRRDIGAANEDVVNGEWKGATVLAGAATEALLLWAVEEAERQNKGLIQRTISSLGSKLAPDPERWNLGELIDVAARIQRIKPDTAVQAKLGKDFRNLIHPGRAARLRQVCDRATALSALAAVEHVVRDLTP